MNLRCAESPKAYCAVRAPARVERLSCRGLPAARRHQLLQCSATGQSPSHTDTDIITHTSSLTIWHWHGLALYFLIWAARQVSGEKTVEFVLD